MKTYQTVETKNAAIIRANEYRAAGNFWAFGMYWGHSPQHGKEMGSVLGAMYKDYLAEGEAIQDVPKIAERVHGIPEPVAYIMNGFFRELFLNPDKEPYQRWAQECYEAIPENVDLSPVPDRLALHILETPALLSEYANAKTAYLCGVLKGIYEQRAGGEPCLQKLQQLYVDEIQGMHRHQYQGDTPQHQAVSVIRVLTVLPLQPYSWPVLLHALCRGSARHQKKEQWKVSTELSARFLNLLRQAT